MAATTANEKTISMVQGHLIYLVTKYLLPTTYQVLYQVLRFQW